ncbi:methyl-accepting chemotaxis protein [Vibrio tapetis subsp. quintayensis]|uniref:methyl-accepting chemotaxis protein n=1 Tax=Vibrio tapetis TaxID=52443 RepID=UPI0025B3B24E|nr:methyl-accepting chemotaxis protein [Vibrio tapetis]MDN3682942.1 methyl-accepting chemotaxis protein [Vibrio tapetis subsp. quintayensis]
MNLTIRSRLYVLSIAPLLIIALSLMYITYVEVMDLSNDQTQETRTTMMDMKKAELRSYIDIAETALIPLTKRQATLEEALEVLRGIKFGSSGYFFGYNSKGDRVLLGSQNKGLGDNFWASKDTAGNLFIQDIINNAKNKEFSTYYFPKPGQSAALPKLALSVYFPQWDLAIGTGFYTDDIDGVVATMDARADKKVNEAIIKIAIIGLIIAGFVLAVAVMVNRSIMRPLEVFEQSIKSFANGDADLTARMEKFSVPEFGSLSGNFNLFVKSLQNIIKNVSDVSIQVVGETNDMSRRASEVDKLATGQREETEQVATAMTEMTTTAHDISANANQAAQSAKDADDNAINANSIVVSAAQSVEALAEEISQANSVISDLEGDVKNISSSLEVIQDIAEQTNLLALNAAIEAARAGEQGRGFAVVADEVRKLASRTQESTGEIHKMIEQLKAASDAAVSAMNSSQDRSQTTVEEANAASKALDKVQQSIHVIMDMNALIATATEEQSIVGQEISERIVVISDQSASSASLANENRSGSKVLNGKANELSELVGRFTV